MEALLNLHINKFLQVIVPMCFCLFILDLQLAVRGSVRNKGLFGPVKPESSPASVIMGKGQSPQPGKAVPWDDDSSSLASAGLGDWWGYPASRIGWSSLVSHTQNLPRTSTLE